MSDPGRSNRLADYLARVGLDTPPAPDAAGLASLQRAQRLNIAFENLDIPLGRVIAIDRDSVFAKLVGAGRGGYCFEQNRLLADMLALLGLPTRPLLARVWLLLPPGEVPPRTHTLLLAELGGELWIADAGFGGGFCPPLPLRDGATAGSPDGASHRLRRAGAAGSIPGEWLLERRAAGSTAWLAQYGFDSAEVALADLEAANHWTATRRGTRFTTLHVANRVLPTGLAALTDRTFTRFDGPASTSCTIATPAEWHALLTGTIGIALPPEDVAALPLFMG